jgi:hypothetical protein
MVGSARRSASCKQGRRKVAVSSGLGCEIARWRTHVGRLHQRAHASFERHHLLRLDFLVDKPALDLLEPVDHPLALLRHLQELDDRLVALDTGSVPRVSELNDDGPLDGGLGALNVPVEGRHRSGQEGDGVGPRPLVGREGDPSREDAVETGRLFDVDIELELTALR